MSGGPGLGRAGKAAIVGGCAAIAVLLAGLAADAYDGETGGPVDVGIHADSDVPSGCALGISGPALRPATPLRAARDAAFVALAVEAGPTRLRSELRWVGGWFREASEERTSGVFTGARFAGVRARAGGGVDALVCRHDTTGATRAMPRPWRDAWPRPLSPHAGCALGLAGRDLDPPTRLRSARRDALEMLARAFEVEVDHTLQIQGGARVSRAQHVRATRTAQQRAAALAPDFEEATWLDPDGRGPLEQAGVLYVRLCPMTVSKAEP